VVNLDDQPLAGIRVTLFNEESLAGDVGASQTITTEVDGRFTFTQVTELPYWLQFSDLTEEYAGEFYDDQPNFEDAGVLLVPNSSTLTVTAQLTRAVAITGHVSDLSGQPYEGVEVQLFTYWPGRPEPWQVYDTAATDAEGNYRFNGLTPYAKYRVKFEKEGILLYYPNASSLAEAEDVVVTTQALLPNINATINRPGEVKAEFSGTPLAGTGSLSVIFTDQSLGPVSARTWDFGDGATSVQANPIHTYTLHGVYTVTLTVTGPINSSVARKINYVSLTDIPISDLAIEHSAAGGLEPLVGQTLYFSATAEGSNIDYLWDFGDDALGAAATTKGQYVQHSYETTGTYTVTLTASNGVGEAVATLAVTIRQEEVEEPLSGLAIHGPTSAFVDESVTFSATVDTGDNVTYTWDLGDTNIMTGPVVSHTYTAPGRYDVRLTANNSESELEATTSITIAERIIPPQPRIIRMPRVWSQPQ
jgi:PKD repeat protein